MQKYSRGRRGAPAKGVGWETGARVQIPPSAESKNFFKKAIDNHSNVCYYVKAVREGQQQKHLEKRITVNAQTLKILKKKIQKVMYTK